MKIFRMKIWNGCDFCFFDFTNMLLSTSLSYLIRNLDVCVCVCVCVCVWGGGGGGGGSGCHN